MSPMVTLRPLSLAVALSVLLGAAAPAVADFVGHGGMVRAISISPDGKRMLSGSFDYSAALWDFEEQRQIATLDGHEGPVTNVKFFAGGKRVATTSDDRKVRIWALDGDTPKLLRSLEGHGHKVMALAVDPAGRWLASGGWDKTVRLWNPDDGTEIRKIDTGVPVNALAIAGGGKRIIVGGHDPLIRVFDAETGLSKGKLEGHRMGITDLAVSDDGAELLSAGIDKTVHLWDLNAFTEIAHYQDHEHQVYAVRFVPGDKSFVSAGRDGIIVHRKIGGDVIRAIKAHDKIIWSLTVSPDGRFVVSSSSDDTARVWHLATGDRIGTPAEAENANEPKPWLTSDHPGAKLFGKCARCHSLSAEGVRRSGPHLKGLFGRKVGSVPGYNYSSALKRGDFRWDEKTLFELFDKGPDKYLPGTKMPVQRVPDAQQLAQLIEYLHQITAANGAN
jgi:cytochrome c